MLKGIGARVGKAAARFATGRVVIFLAGLVLAASTWAAWATWRMEDLQQKLGACDEIQRTSEANADAATELGRRLAQEVNRRALDERQQAQAQRRWEREMEQLQTANAADREQRERIYATDDTCSAWRTALVCADIADSLRASRDAAARAGRGSDAGADSDPQ